MWPSAEVTQLRVASSQDHYQIAQIGGSIVPGTTDIGNHGDDTVTTIALPFSYTFYDQTFTSINLSSNGNAQFTTTDNGDFSNRCLPWLTHNYTIYPYWDDLYLAQSGFGIFTSVSGTAPNRIFNIEWRAQYFPPSSSANFELRLYEGQKRFDIIYGPVGGGNTSATAGVQKNDTTFDQYFCNGSGGAATGGQSYMILPCGTPSPTPTATATPRRHCHVYSYANAYSSESDAYIYSYANANSDSHVYTNCHCHVYSYANAYRSGSDAYIYSNANANSDGYVYTNCNCHVYSYADAYRPESDAYIYLVRQRQQRQLRLHQLLPPRLLLRQRLQSRVRRLHLPVRQRQQRRYVYADGNSDSYVYAYANTNSYSHARTDANRYSYSHSYSCLHAYA